MKDAATTLISPFGKIWRSLHLQANAWATVHKLIAHAVNMLPKAVEALELMSAHYDDMSKSNPGFMGKLVLQDYVLWNRALMAMGRVLAEANSPEVGK